VNRILLALIALLLAGCSTVPVTSRPQIRLVSNAVEGGKNGRSVQWLKTVEQQVERELPVDMVILQDGSGDENYKAKLVLDLYGGTGPDLICIDSFWTAGMASAGLLQPLDAWLPNLPEWKNVLPATRAMGVYEGRTYVLPLNTDVRGIYYRTDLFRKAGIPLPWRPQSWEEILQAGEALKKAGVQVPIQWCASATFGEATTMQGFYPLLLSAGGALYENGQWVTDSPAMRQTLGFYRDVYVERKLGDVNLQLDPKGRERALELFRDGKIGMFSEGTYMWMEVLRPGGVWGIPNRDEVVDWAPMPKQGGGRVSISGGWGYILNKNSPHLDLAWKTLKILFSNEAQERKLQINPEMVPRDDLLDAPVFQDDEVLLRQMNEALPVTTFRPGLPVYPRVSELVQQMTEETIQGQPVDSVLAEYRRRLEALGAIP